MNQNIRKFVIPALCVMSIGTMCCACTPKTRVPVNKVHTTADLKSYHSVVDRNRIELAENDWKPFKDTELPINTRDPFKGFVDSAMSETSMRQQTVETVAIEHQLPEQMYGTREYKVTAVITGTADPKAYILDPAGNRFILRRGALLGNNNGSISSIRRDGIEVYERVADKGQYIELPLYSEESSKANKIQLTVE